MKLLWRLLLSRPAVAAAAFVALTTAATAQVKTTTNTTDATPTKEVKVDRGIVERVSGNDIWVKMEDGSVRHAHVPDSARATVDGQEIGVHDLKPGMKLERTITTTTTPRTVTTVQTVTGKVWHVAPPKTVILTLENGQNQSFTVPDGQKFKIDGQETDVWHLKKGMTVSATKVVEAPETVVEHERQITGSSPPPLPPLPSDMPVLIARATPVPAPAAAPSPAETPTELPKTGSPVSLIGLLGLLFSGASLLVRFTRH
ncbi:MAG TPA: LPXTG cell wall anchor domain-containing protein [Terriglobales bacterium]|nr:LPXTG cell wall anchor domain-containing protein [Terriglobales bacterium]